MFSATTPTVKTDIKNESETFFAAFGLSEGTKLDVTEGKSENNENIPDSFSEENPPNLPG